MKLSDRLHWFGYNLIRFIVGIPFQPFYIAWSFVCYMRVFFITDGSETLSWPWEWGWSENGWED